MNVKNLDDFIIAHGVKTINISKSNDHNIMRNVTVLFIKGHKFEIFCHEDNVVSMLRIHIPQHSVLGQRKKKIEKIINNEKKSKLDNRKVFI